MRYAVKRYWELCDTVHVEADDIDKAIEAAHELSVDNSKAEFVPDSMNSDPSCDVQPVIAETYTVACGLAETEMMKLLIIDLYGDGESLRVCEDQPGVDRVIAEFMEPDESDEHFDEFLDRKGIYLFITRRVSLEHLPKIVGAKTDSIIRRSNV